MLIYESKIIHTVKGEYMYADENVIKIKHEVLYEVARLAFEGKLDEKKENIPFELIPGPTPQFRCCIYKEREIIRQRVRLAEGENLYGNDEQNVIQVIHSACEDCPISSYTVTENCQNCIGKACINACKFGAIVAGRHRSHIDRRSARSAAAAHRHVRTMQSRIWCVRARTAVRLTPLHTMKTAYQ